MEFLAATFSLVDWWRLPILFYYHYYLTLKEMLFRKGRRVSIHVVLRFASYGDVTVLYLV